MFMREIETARLRLPTWREDDLAPYARICADPEVMRYLSGPMTREHSEQQISKFVRYWEERGFGLWAVEEKSSGAFIGFIGLLYHEDWSEGKHRMEVGWRLARPFWGRSLATEGAMASLRYGLEEVGLDRIISIAVRLGRAYVTGTTNSANYPTTRGVFDRTFNGGFQDAFVTKLNASGSALAYSTFLGGTDFDEGADIAVDGKGRAYVTGVTNSADYPTTPDAFDTSFNGAGPFSFGAFVTKLPTG
jgi:RimJ/RimL family protein N-acetyltransferase